MTPPSPPATRTVWQGQPAPAAMLGQILTHAAMELLDAAALHDQGWMWEEARAIATRILASCPTD